METISIIQELQELLQDTEQWKKDGTPLNEASIKYAIAFVEGSDFIKDPHIEIHPEGEVVFTWRVSGSGILNIAFNKEGWATWVVYNIEPKYTKKGRFKVGL